MAHQQQLIEIYIEQASVTRIITWLNRRIGSLERKQPTTSADQIYTTADKHLQITITPDLLLQTTTCTAITFSGYPIPWKSLALLAKEAWEVFQQAVYYDCQDHDPNPLRFKKLDQQGNFSIVTIET